MIIAFGTAWSCTVHHNHGPGVHRFELTKLKPHNQDHLFFKCICDKGNVQQSIIVILFTRLASTLTENRVCMGGTCTIIIN